MKRVYWLVFCIALVLVAVLRSWWDAITNVVKIEMNTMKNKR